MADIEDSGVENAEVETFSAAPFFKVIDRFSKFVIGLLLVGAVLTFPETAIYMLEDPGDNVYERIEVIWEGSQYETFEYSVDEYSGNMRLFEATGSESLVITNFSEDLNDYFNDDEIVSYHNKNDALEKIKYFINNPQERRRIAANGKKRVLKSFSYEVRIKDINKIILENF